MHCNTPEQFLSISPVSLKISWLFLRRTKQSCCDYCRKSSMLYVHRMATCCALSFSERTAFKPWSNILAFSLILMWN